MDYKQILEIAILITASLAFIALTVFSIQDIIESNKYWKKMEAELKLYRNALHKENDVLKKLHAFDDWLGDYCGIMYTNAELDDNEFNDGVANAANDIQESFLNYLGEYVNGEESSD